MSELIGTVRTGNMQLPATAQVEAVTVSAEQFNEIRRKIFDASHMQVSGSLTIADVQALIDLVEPNDPFISHDLEAQIAANIAYSRQWFARYRRCRRLGKRLARKTHHYCVPYRARSIRRRKK